MESTSSPATDLTPKAHEWIARIQAWETSGQTLRAWCAEHGVKAGTLAWWKKRLVDQGIDVTAPTADRADADPATPPAPTAIEEPTARAERRPLDSAPAPASLPVPAPMPTPTVEAPAPTPAPAKDGRARVGPIPVIAGGTDEEPLTSPKHYLNRELTWLSFCRRVLAEAADPRNPLLERLWFLSIVGSNVDEFLMKRLGGLKQQLGAGLHERTVDGRGPQEQIAACHEGIRAIRERMPEVLHDLLAALEPHGIAVVPWAQLGGSERKALRQHYLRDIFPLVTPQAMDPAHPFPFISNLSLNLLVTVSYPDQPEQTSLARVKVPKAEGIGRFVRVGPGVDRFVLLEDLMANNLDLLFPGMVIHSVERFRVIRNANTEKAEESADDLLAMIESELAERRFAPIVALGITKEMTPLHKGMLSAELGLDEDDDVFGMEGMLGMADLAELASLDHPKLHFPKHTAATHPDLVHAGSIFHQIREPGSVLVCHPFQAFATSVDRFLREAAEDPKVLAIKMTLYRTAEDSRIIEHLVDAARHGKQVAVVVELKARFDEAANIRWANRLEEHGIHVTYGVVGLKTHCKVIVVVRRDYNGLRRYVHIGTGNYHAGTARGYTDIGLFTADERVGAGITELFNYLTTGYKPKRDYGDLVVAPRTMKRTLLALIEQEITNHRKGKKSGIQFKTNALEDADITRALYQAGQAGVPVDLIVRDTCRLRPGLPGLSESIRVISVVGRFLEHSRIYKFERNGKPTYYIGSADCMKRNLESRVELLVPVDHPDQKADLQHLIDTLLADNRRAWDMHPDGTYVQRRPAEGEPERDSQLQLIAWAEARMAAATRLRKRRTKGLGNRRRN